MQALNLDTAFVFCGGLDEHAVFHHCGAGLLQKKLIPKVQEGPVWAWERLQITEDHQPRPLCHSVSVRESCLKSLQKNKKNIKTNLSLKRQNSQSSRLPEDAVAWVDGSQAGESERRCAPFTWNLRIELPDESQYVSDSILPGVFPWCLWSGLRCDATVHSSLIAASTQPASCSTGSVPPAVRASNRPECCFVRLEGEKTTLRKSFQSVALCCDVDGDAEQQSVETAQQKCDKSTWEKAAKCIKLSSRHHIRQTQQQGRTAN